MHQSLDQQLTWQQIAQQSAISPAHFHRQFKTIFYETPGHYLNRIRLQFATGQLLTFPARRVTDIAHQSGFSESQALAKALKRTLRLTAKAIKKMASDATPQQTGELIEKLAQPFVLGSMEQNLAEKIPAELLWVNQRSGKAVEVENSDWEVLFAQFGSRCMNLIALTPMNQLNRGWQQIECTVCDWNDTMDSHNILIKEGYYLSAIVTLTSTISYLAAFDGLFNIAKQRGLTVDPNGHLIEQLLHSCEEAGVTFLIQIPIGH